MKSSLCHHVLLDIPSAAVVLGTTEGELYAHFKNEPPFKLTLAEIDNLAKQRLKDGKCDSFWFESEAAQKDPLLIHTFDKLEQLLEEVLDISNEEFFSLFRINLPKNLNLGGVLEALRMINFNYPSLTGELHVLLERLSKVGFFRLA